MGEKTREGKTKGGECGRGKEKGERKREEAERKVKGMRGREEKRRRGKGRKRKEGSRKN